MDPKSAFDINMDPWDTEISEVLPTNLLNEPLESVIHDTTPATPPSQFPPPKMAPVFGTTTTTDAAGTSLVAKGTMEQPMEHHWWPGNAARAPARPPAPLNMQQQHCNPRFTSHTIYNPFQQNASPNQTQQQQRQQQPYFGLDPRNGQSISYNNAEDHNQQRPSVRSSTSSSSLSDTTEEDGLAVAARILKNGLGPLTATHGINHIDLPFPGRNGTFSTLIYNGARLSFPEAPMPLLHCKNELPGNTKTNPGGRLQHDLELVSSDYQLGAQSLSQFVRNGTVFYIEPKSYCAMTAMFEAAQFGVCALRDPSFGFPRRYVVEMAEDDYIEHTTKAYHRRLKCTIQPEEIGVYRIAVTVKVNVQENMVSKHIDGSPMSIAVGKNYIADAKKSIAIKVELEKLRAILSPSVPLLSPTQNVISMASYMNFASSSPVPTCKPWGLTYGSKTDEIFVTARETHEIFKFSAENGTFIAKFGAYGSNPGQFFRPTGICYDRITDRLIIADKDNHRICFFNVDGEYLSSFGSKGYHDGKFTYPWGVDSSKDGRFIVVADSRNHRVQMFDVWGKFLAKYSVFEKSPFEYKSTFNYPRAVCFSPNCDRIYVSDFNLNQIFSLDMALTQQEQFLQHGTLLRPQGMTVDPVGNLIICDNKNNCLRIYSSIGVLIATIHGFGQAEYYFGHDGCLYAIGAVSRGLDQTSSTTVNEGPPSTPSPPPADKLIQPLDVCCLNNGKIAVLDNYGIIRIF